MNFSRKTIMIVAVLMAAMSVMAATTNKKAQKAFDKGLEYVSKNNNEKAEGYFLKAIEKDPGFSEAYIELAKVEAGLGKLDQSEAHLQKAYDLGGNTAVKALNILIELSKYLKDMDKQADYCIKKLELLKDNATEQDAGILDVLAISFFQAGNSEKSISLYKKLMELRPSYTYAYLNLSKVYLALKQNDKAIALLKDAVENAHSNEEMLNMLSILYMQQKDTEKAAPILEKIVDIKTSKYRRDAIADLINYYIEKKENKKVLGLCEVFLADYPDDTIAKTISERADKLKKMMDNEADKK